jgi:hypothetical protein
MCRARDADKVARANAPIAGPGGPRTLTGAGVVAAGEDQRDRRVGRDRDEAGREQAGASGSRAWFENQAAELVRSPSRGPLAVE